MALDTSSKNIEGIADLVVSAPIKNGFIDAFENVTFETRLRLTAQALHQLRVAAREYEMSKPFADIAERIQSLRAFRIGILDTQPQRRLILAATFDRALEPYMRLIWNPLGAFLDLLFCNCEGYVTATDHSFAEYLAWVRANQVDSTIFYATSPLGVTDEAYLIKLERLQRGGGSSGADLELARMTADDPSELAAEARTFALRTGAQPRADFLTMAIEALVVLYRLADLYPADRLDGDGKYLLRAAQNLFDGWDTTNPAQLPPPIKASRADQFKWLETPMPPPAPTPDPKFLRSQVQLGVLGGYDRKPGPIKHGCLLLLGITDASKARAFLRNHVKDVSYETDTKPRNADGVFINVAFTRQGLENIGVRSAVVNAFPKEFRDGMAERAGLLGDIHGNHPRRWPLPVRFLEKPSKSKSNPAVPDGNSAIRPRVQLNEIDIVLQFRTANGPWDFVELPNEEAALDASAHPLAPVILKLLPAAKAAGVRLLGVEPMRRIAADPKVADSKMREHFGFLDFVSQPTAVIDHPPIGRDAVALGELVVGYANDQGDPPLVDDPAAPDHSRPFLVNGSFMAIRKMSQDVAALNDFVDDPPAPAGAAAKARPPTGEDLLAKMVGRFRDGTPLVAGGAAANNDFDFAGDKRGDLCPFQAHMRRTNPRLTGLAAPFGRPTPRIMRRGMSYGKTFDEEKPAPRGAMFIAYSASLAHQFEVILRWINGGSSTGVAAVQNDPLMGTMPPPVGADPAAKTFRFPHAGSPGGVARVEIAAKPDGSPPFVAVEWGLYAFLPSRDALALISDLGSRVDDHRRCGAWRGDPRRVERTGRGSGQGRLEDLSRGLRRQGSGRALRHAGRVGGDPRKSWRRAADAGRGAGRRRRDRRLCLSRPDASLQRLRPGAAHAPLHRPDLRRPRSRAALLEQVDRDKRHPHGRELGRRIQGRPHGRAPGAERRHRLGEGRQRRFRRPVPRGAGASLGLHHPDVGGGVQHMVRPA